MSLIPTAGLRRAPAAGTSDPRGARQTGQYEQEYVEAFVDKWDSLIDWKRRAAAEGDFFIETLRAIGARKVLDVATGTGFHSVLLHKAGFEVTSADGSKAMLSRAFQNAREHGYVLRTIHADWRWLNRHVHDLYDAVICLGNSFTHLHKENDRRKALAEFYATLRHEGTLILDQRNYDAILDKQITPGHSYYYCGENVRAFPEYIDPTLARFRYEFADGTRFHLDMFPLRKGYVRRLMREVGFQSVTTYGDFQETYRDREPDYFIHVAGKAYVDHEEPEGPVQ
jgi:glycine/sarcosine N-methyltransferase